MKNYIVKIVWNGKIVDQFENVMTVEQARTLESEPEFIVTEA